MRTSAVFVKVNGKYRLCAKGNTLEMKYKAEQWTQNSAFGMTFIFARGYRGRATPLLERW
jgi:hypothetical protein